MPEAAVCVYGLGYIGLPTAAVLADTGHAVTGVDIDEALVESLEAGAVPVEERGLADLLADVLETGALTVSSTPREADYHLICVPTPLAEGSRSADLAHVEAAAGAVADRLTPGATVVLESTVPPGTTTDVVRPILESSGLVAGREFGLAFSPETVLPGDILGELRSNDRIVGGIDARSTAAARALYATFTDGEIHETAATTAEMAKLTQNTFRDLNIAFANELATIAREHDVDSGALVDLANTHPRVLVHRPGPGVGGHCLPIDPWFLIEDSEYGALVETARAVNDSMAASVIELLETALGSLEDRTIGVLGLAYKGNVADTRESPGLAILETLQQIAGTTVLVNDPHVEAAPVDLVDLETVIERAEGLIVATDHDEYAACGPPAAVEADPPVARDGSGRVVVDAKRVLDSDRWHERGYRVVTL